MSEIQIESSNINSWCNYLCAVLIFFEARWISLFILILQRIGLGEFGEPLFYIVLTAAFVVSLHRRRLDSLGLVALIYVSFSWMFVYAKVVSPDSFVMDTSGFSVIKFFLYYPLIIIVFSSLEDYDHLIDIIIKAARLFAIVLAYISYTTYLRNGYSFAGYASYDMTHGYECAKVAAVLLLSLSLKKKKFRLFDIVAFLAMAFSSFVFGSRGSILMLFVYFIIIYLKNYLIDQPSNKRIVLFAFTCIVAILVGIYYYEILGQLSETLSRLNISSRTLDKMLNSSISTDTGRSVLQLQVIERWKDMPIFGYGILGDRQFISGSYVHSLILELITDFGYVLGVIMVIAIVVLVVKSIRNERKRELCLLIETITLVNLMISSSFVVNTNFYIMLAVLATSRIPYNKIEFGKQENLN